MARRRRSFLWAVFVSLFGLSIVGFYILLVPHNPLTMMFRSSISDTKGRVVTGPYPVRSDFRELRDHGVTTVVSLLDPRIPYEKILLDQERENAQRYGMKFYDFPMASILGQRMGDYYQTDAALAARTIDSLKNEKVYLHCYLGVHRMNVVRTMLEQHGTLTGTYTVRESERSRSDREMDSAFICYRNNDLRQAIAHIDAVKAPDAPAIMIRGWSHYRLNQIPQAVADFRTVIATAPALIDAHNGLGYCMLRTNDLDSAETHFMAVIKDGSNPQAQAGLAMVHYREGKLDDARQLLETSLAADSTNTEARNLLFRIRDALAARQMVMR